MVKKNKSILGVFIGEATGIGPEVTAKVFAENKFKSNIVLFGSPDIFEQGIKIADVEVKYEIFSDINEVEFHKSIIPFVHIKGLATKDYELATINSESGKYTGKVLELMVNLTIKKIIHGLVFAPINKEAFHAGGYKSKDEMGFFVDLLEVKNFYAEIVNYDEFWLARVTSHIRLKDVSKNITEKSLMDSIELASNTLEKFGIKNPSIAIPALNPHAGDGGLFGDEEIIVIKPTIDKAKKLGYNVSGPYAADTVFIKLFNREFDAVLCLYHDQGQIPMKLMKFSQGAGIYAGLPILAASPSHGTAFDIVGKGVANPGPLKQAIKLCDRAANL